jgi:RNA polymerase sigma factor (sigma-70 family)
MTRRGIRVAHWTDVLEEVLRTRRGALVGYASLLTLDRAEAEDVLHEALVRTFAHRRSLPDAASAEAYVRQAIRTTFLDVVRRRRGWGERAHLLVADDGHRSPEDTAAVGLDVRAALRALPPRERACVVLRYLDDLTVHDVASELGLSEGAVKRYLSDGTRTMRGLLGDSVQWAQETETVSMVIECTTAGRTA